MRPNAPWCVVIAFALSGLNVAAAAQCVPYLDVELLSLSPDPGERIGASVAIDGDTGVIGSVNGIRLLNRTEPGVWVSTVPLRAPGAASDALFGASVALCEQVIAVGASRDGGSIPETGAAYVLSLTNASPPVFHRLESPSPQTGAWFGRAVSVSGTTVAVGAPRDGLIEPQAGSVSLFTYSGGVWAHQQTITPPSASPMLAFGTSVSIDGGTLAIGAPGDDTGAANAGAVYVYDLVNGSWTLSDVLIADDASVFDAFGQSVDVQDDTIAVGAWAEDEAGPNAGAAYVFRRAGPTWIEQQKLVSVSGSAGDMLGASVEIDEDHVIVGSVRADGAEPDTGAGVVFRHTGGAWDEIAIFPGRAGGSFAGASVAIDQGTALIGSPLDSGAGLEAGHVMAFDVTSPACPADLNLDCALDVDDAIAFLDGFEREQTWADRSAPEGVFDFCDVMAFLSDFVSGCP